MTNSEFKQLLAAEHWMNPWRALTAAFVRKNNLVVEAWYLESGVR